LINPGGKYKFDLEQVRSELRLLAEKRRQERD
jgi:hypothetical protein